MQLPFRPPANCMTRSGSTTVYEGSKARFDKDQNSIETLRKGGNRRHLHLRTSSVLRL